MPRYRWNSPQEWLAWKTQEQSEDLPFLRGLIVSLLDKIDPEDVQEIFQQEMDEDGYFNPEPEEVTAG